MAKPFCFYQSTLLLKFFLKILNNVQTNAFAQSMNVFVFNSLICNLDLSTKYHTKTFYSKISSKKDVSYVYLFCCSQESIHWRRPIFFFWEKNVLLRVLYHDIDPIHHQSIILWNNQNYSFIQHTYISFVICLFTISRPLRKNEWSKQRIMVNNFGIPILVSLSWD